MARIVVNGVTNALKFCCEGSIDIRLGMHATNRDVFQLSITDDGPGIEPSLIPRLLEPFAKQDVHTPGIGLGLHITKTLVQNLGGRLDIPWTDTQDRTRNDRLLDPHRHGMSDLMREVISAQCTAPRRPALAHHSRHDISGCSSSAQSNYAPLRTPEDDVQDPPRFLPVGATEGKPVDSACAVEPMRIMIIDDNDICRRLLAALVLKMVRKATKQSSQQVKPLVRQYSDGRSAVDSFLAFRPHLVLTDVSMPGMDGVTAAQHMRMLGQQQGSEFSDPFSNGYADTAQESAAGGSTQWSVGRCLIYAITGLGSSDPRLRASGMLGSAALDGWLVKGKDDMPRVEEIVRTLAAKLQYS